MAPKKDTNNTYKNDEPLNGEPLRQDLQQSESKNKQLYKDAFLDYFTKFKESQKESLKSFQKDADPISALKSLDKIHSKCINMLF